MSHLKSVTGVLFLLSMVVSCLLYNTPNQLSTPLLDKPTVVQLVQNFPAIMKPEIHYRVPF
jgi:hypothetical protein